MGRMPKSELRLWSVLISLATVAVLAGAPNAPPRQTPSLSVSPGSGPAGSKVTLSGSGFTFVSGGSPAQILWDGKQVDSFDMPKGGSFSIGFTIPSGAAPGTHTITVCNQCGSEFQEAASAGFKVTEPPTVPPPPTNTPPPPTNTAPAPTVPPPTIPPPPGPTVPLAPTSTPTQTPAAGLPATVRPDRPPLFPESPVPQPVGRCGDLGLGPEVVVLDFEESLVAQESRTGVDFAASGQVITPAVSTRSGTRALRSLAGEEFGSFLRPIRMHFARPLAAVGTFVGLEEVLDQRGQITAVLSAYGYRAGGTEVTLLGQDTVTMPAGPAPVRYCVAFEAAAGETIVRAEVEYRDPSGRSTVEPRLIDDLTLVYADSALPEDRPPIVDILWPPFGWPLSGYTYFTVGVTEDRGLRRLWYQIGNGPPVVVRLNPPLADMRYETAVGITLLGSGWTDVTFGAEDTAGKIGTDRLSFNLPTPLPPLDLEAVAVEAVQVVQCLNDPGCRDNSIPITANRPTLVRLYLRQRTSDIPTQPIRGELCNTAFGRCVNSTNVVFPRGDPDPVRNHRSDPNRTLNFMIPMDWIPASRGRYTLDLQVTVNPNRWLSETDYENNVLPLNLEVQPGRRLRVNFLRVSVGGMAPALTARDELVDWLERVYPVTEVQIVNVFSDVPFRIGSLSDSSGDGCGEDWNTLLAAIKTRLVLDLLNERVSVGVHYYGMVPSGVPTDGTIGCGNLPGWTGAGIVTPGTRSGGQIAAQELGHNRGLRHAPNDPAVNCNADGIDRSFPTADGKLDVWGTDVGRLQTYDPSTSYDYMGYCGGENNTWTSAYTYSNLRLLLPMAAIPAGGEHVASRRAQETERGEFVVLAGVIDPDRVDVQSGPYRMTLRGQDTTPEGPFLVELLNVAGEPLYQRVFRAVPLSNDDARDTGTFFLTLPAVDGIQAIRFWYLGTEIGRLAASPGSPTVRLVSPSGGEDWGSGGLQTVRWEAQDPDGDPLRFTLQASHDGGERWSTLALDLAGEYEFVFDVSDLAGGDYIVRVLASDGFHSAEDRSEAAVRVGAKPPQVRIVAPADGSTFPVGELVVLQGIASDLEDGAVEEEAYLWTSNRDGELGRASTLWALPLSAGEHTITLRVADRDGSSAEASVRITVLGSTAEDGEGVTPETGEPPAGDSLVGIPLPLVLTALALLGLIGVALLLYAARGLWRK